MKGSKKLLSSFLTLVMVVSMLFAGFTTTASALTPPTPPTGGSTGGTSVTSSVYNEADLTQALADVNITTINFADNIILSDKAVSDYLQINRPVIIDGQNHTLNKGIAVEYASVTLKNLNITASKFYDGWYYGVMVSDVQGVQIIDNTIIGIEGTDAIAVSDKTGNTNASFTVSGTHMSKGWVGVIVDSPNTKAIITNNTVTDMKHGIYLENADLAKINVTNNAMSNPRVVGDGVTAGDGITLPVGTSTETKMEIQAGNTFTGFATAKAVVILAEIFNVNITSNNADPTRARVGNTVAVTFSTYEQVFQLETFNVNGNVPTTFDSMNTGETWKNVATYVIKDADAEGKVNFQINVNNAAGVNSSAISQTTDGSSVTVTKSPEISNVTISSSNADATRAKVGDTVTLKFTTTGKVTKLGTFKINGSNPTTFNSTWAGSNWLTVATYVVEDSDAEGKVSFQINVQNAAGFYSQTTETTSDGSSVTILKAPVISNVSLSSNNADTSRAKPGDTVTLKFTTNQHVTKLGGFKVNGSNPTTFTSTGEGSTWNNVATYVIEQSDPEGLMTFQINVQNELGVYSITTEATTDGSGITVSQSPEIVSVSIASNNADSTKAKVGDTVSLTFTTKEEVRKLNNFKINGGNPVSFTSTNSGTTWTNVATYLIDESDAEALMNFQINVQSVRGFNSITTEATTDGSSVEVMKMPVINSVSIKSSNSNQTLAHVGDTITLTFTTNQQVSKLGSFKINGSNPTTFASTGSGNTWTTVATYVIEDSDASGVMTFQINVKNVAGLYSITTEATTDGSFVQVRKLISSITGNNILLVGGYAFDLSNTESGYDLNNFLVAANTAYAYPVDTYHIYFRIGGKWYDIVSDLTTPIVNEATINGDGLFDYMNMQK